MNVMTFDSSQLLIPSCLDLKTLIGASTLDENIKKFLFKVSKSKGHFVNLVKVYTVVHVLLHREIINAQYKFRAWIPIPFELLARVTGLRHSVLKKYVLDVLIFLKVIKVKRFKAHANGKYAHRYCFEYRLLPPYSLKSGIKIVPLGILYELSKTQKKAISGFFTEKVVANTHLEMQMLENIKRLRLSAEVYTILETLPFEKEEYRTRARMLLNAINAPEKTNSLGDYISGWFFHRHPEIKRVYSTPAGIDSGIRKRCLFVDGNKLHEIDQSASQPFLLLAFYRGMKGDKEAIERESAKYFSLWNEGAKDFYLNFCALTGSKCTRDEMKLGFIVGLNAKDWCHPPEEVKKEVLKVITNTLKEHFPLLYREIDRLKNVRNFDIAKKLKKDRNGNDKVYSQFGIKMQQNEAEIFIDGIAMELAQKGIFFYSVHDCIGCLEKDMPAVRECMSRHLREKIGFEPVLK